MADSASDTSKDAQQSDWEESDDEIYNKFQNMHVLGTPLIDILSVTIHNDNGLYSEVFGTIQLTDGGGAVFSLYNRNCENAETIATADSLTLTIPRDHAISASGQVVLSVHLEDKVQKDVLAQGTCCWDYSTKDDYDEIQTEKFGGKCGYGTIQYVTYRHAVIATIDVFLLRGKNDDSINGCANVFGEIMTHSGSNSITLFNKKQTQAVRVTTESSINLSRHVVVVPAYSSSLILAARLWNDDLESQLVCQDLEFYTTHWSCGQQKNVEGQNGHVRVQVQWTHAFMNPPMERKVKHDMGKVSDEDSVENQEMIRVINSDEQPSSTLCRSSYLDLWQSSSNKTCILALEVFCILINSDDDKSLEDVWGLIQFDDWRNTFDFFNKDQTCADRVIPNQPINIVTPKETLTTYDFSILANLKNVCGQVICAGHIHWSERELNLPFQWHDRQLCSVVRGDIGYMVVHYTIFSDAVQASIRVHYVGENSLITVYGNIFTEYSSYSYVTWYEKEHYTNKLFPRISENSVGLSDNYEVPLSKSIVAVPRNASLVVNVDLMMRSGLGDMSDETFKDRLIFETDVGHKRDQRIQGSRWNTLIVYVEWSELPSQ